MTVLAAVVLVVGILELATRAIVWSKTLITANSGAATTFHPTRGIQLKPNYKAAGISINSHGIAGPEFDIEGDPRAIRILAIGDSVTYSPPATNYSRVLERRLKGYLPDARIEVIAAAVSGYTSSDALDWYDEFLHKLNPDIAIVHLGWNDIHQFHPFGLRDKNERLSYRERTALGILMEHVYFLRLPGAVTARLEKSRPVDTSPLTPEEIRILDGFTPRHFEVNLESLTRKLEARGSVVYLVVPAGLITYPPTPEELAKMHFPSGMGNKVEIYKSVYEKYVAALGRVSATTGAGLIDLRALIRTAEVRRIFDDSMHIGTEGAERFGNHVAEALKAQVYEIHMRKARAAVPKKA